MWCKFAPYETLSGIACSNLVHFCTASQIHPVPSIVSFMIVYSPFIAAASAPLFRQKDIAEVRKTIVTRCRKPGTLLGPHFIKIFLTDRECLTPLCEQENAQIRSYGELPLYTASLG
jgi:hypothetical protein